MKIRVENIDTALQLQVLLWKFVLLYLLLAESTGSEMTGGQSVYFKNLVQKPHFWWSIYSGIWIWYYTTKCILLMTTFCIVFVIKY